MGGLESKNYKKFKDLTIDCFLHLRNDRNYILNILNLMVDASIPNLPLEDYKRVLSEMNNRFLPNLSNEEARARFTVILDESVKDVYSEVLEYFHRFNQWKK